MVVGTDRDHVVTIRIINNPDRKFSRRTIYLRVVLAIVQFLC
jgi:hypothetical protein